MVIIDDGGVDGVRCFVVANGGTSGTRVASIRRALSAILEKVDLLVGEGFNCTEITFQGGHGRCLSV